MNENENEFDELKSFLNGLSVVQQEETINYIKSSYIKELAKKYLLTAQEIRASKDKTSEARRKNLKVLLEPIIWLNKFAHRKDNPYRIIFPLWEGRNYEIDFYPFIDEDIIDLKTEIDCTKLKSNKKKYHISFTGSVIDMRHDKVKCFSSIEYDPKILDLKKSPEWLKERIRDVKPNEIITETEYKLRDYYEKWIQGLTSKTMEGNNTDLLDNILFVYAVKRALNGDKTASEKLYSIYEAMAEAEAMKFALELKIKERFFDDIKSDAKFILHHIISGLRPESLISDLQEEDRDKTLLTPQWAEDFYIWYFSEYLPTLLHEGVALFEKYPEDFILQQTIITLLNPYSAINAMTSWQSNNKKRIFNSNSFRPTKKSNLTIWLFGTKAEPMNGRFRQLMKPFFKRYTSGESLEDYKNYDEKIDNSETKIIKSIDAKNAKTPDNASDEDIEMNKMIDLLCGMADISRRNAEIYIKNKVYKEKQEVLRKDFSLSRVQINRIIKEIDSKVKK